MGHKQYLEIIEKFQHYFPGNNEAIRVFFAPGRVNLIGEHTDYNGGYVLPAALTNGTYMAVRHRNDDQFVLRSKNFPGETVEFSMRDSVYKADDGWGNYPKGIVAEFKKLEVDFSGADVYYHGNIPNGAGLSSSASIGMVTAFALASLFNVSITTEEMAKLSQRMENHFIGINTGIMDQFAVGFGKKDHAIFLNCRTLEKEEIPLQLRGYRIIITNTNKRRGLADSKYNERRSECEQGLKRLQQFKPELNELGELSFDQFEKLKESIDNPVTRRRIRHIVTENERVLQAARLLKKGDPKTFGEIMKQSHESLRDDYEVTGKELDTLFNAQKNVKGCIGTRMTGAGFGGCTVSIVESDKVNQFQTTVKKHYQKEIGLAPSFYVSEIGEGVKELKKVVV